MDKIRIAIVGAGYIAHYHARGLLEQQNVEIVASCGLPLEATQEFADKYGIKDVTTDAMSLTTRDDIDAVLIGTPNKFHAPFAIEFLERGKDVFVEKPMAMTPAEGQAMAQAASQHGRLVMVGHMWRFDTEVNYVRDVVQSGKIGEVFKTKGYGIHENWGPAGWFTQKELAGGGALIDMGVHAIDTVRYILGDPKPRAVYAKIGTYFGDWDVDDSGILMITWEGGVTSVIESGWWHPHMDGPEAGTRLFGSTGYASLFPTELKFKIGEFPGAFKAPMPERSEQCDQIIYTRQMEHFASCIRERRAPVPGIAEGQVVLDIVDAAYRSSESGKVVAWE